jgi:hypothetical protein
MKQTRDGAALTHFNHVIKQQTRFNLLPITETKQETGPTQQKNGSAPIRPALFWNQTHA